MFGYGGSLFKFASWNNEAPRYQGGFSLSIPFYTPFKCQKNKGRPNKGQCSISIHLKTSETKGFQIFSGGKERKH